MPEESVTTLPLGWVTPRGESLIPESQVTDTLMEFARKGLALDEERRKFYERKERESMQLLADYMKTEGPLPLRFRAIFRSNLDISSEAS